MFYQIRIIFDFLIWKRMKLLKRILIILSVLLAVALILPAFLPNRYEAEHSALIEVTPRLVFEHVADFRTWDKWNERHFQEKNANRTYEINGDEYLGGKMSWNGDTIGAGSIETIRADYPKSILQKVYISEPIKRNYRDRWDFEVDVLGAKVTLKSSGKLSYFTRYFRSSIENESLRFIQQTLINMKQYLETNINVKLYLQKPFFYYGITDTLKVKNELGTLPQENFLKLEEFFEKHNLERTGLPFCITHEYIHFEKSVITTAFPVADTTLTPEAPIRAGKVRERDAALTMHLGPYSRINTTYHFMHRWGVVNEQILEGEPLEFYPDYKKGEPPHAERVMIVFPMINK